MSTSPSPLALDIARHLTSRWSIEGDWDMPSDEEIAAAIDSVLLPRLAAHADAIEDALTSTTDLRPYPDGPCMDKEVRRQLRNSLHDLRP